MDKRNMRLQLIQLLNRFCFSDHHDSECNGCMFKSFKKCPIATLHDIAAHKIAHEDSKVPANADMARGS